MPTAQHRPVRIYIASSWKNEHGVTLLTKALRDQG